MKATLTLEIEGSKEEIDIVTKRIQNIMTQRKPKVKIQPLRFSPSPTWKKNQTRGRW